MVEGAYSKQRLTQYLLGSLPETEVERFDELSVTDNEFVDALRLAENDLVDAYVQGELSDDEMDQFKSHYLSSPLRREKVQFSRVFQAFNDQNAGIAREGIGESSAKAATQHKRAGWFSGSAFFAPQFALRWGLTVAAVALLVSGGWLAFENIRLRQEMSETQASRDALLRREQELQKEIEGQRSTNSEMEQELARLRDERERLEQGLKPADAGATPRSGADAIASLILAPPLRGASQTPAISIKPATNQVAAQLQLEDADYSAYRVALVDPASKQTLWRSGTLKPRVRGGRKSIEANFRADLLKQQNYILEVTGISGRVPEVVGDYPFKVVK